MEHKQAMGLEELEKGQRDLKETMYQMKEMMTSLIKERWIAEGPNFQERSVHEKNDNLKVGHPGQSKLISHHAEIKPFVRPLVSSELNSRTNPTDPIDVSNLDHFSGQGKFIKGSIEQSKERHNSLIERLEKVEGMNGIGNVDVNELILVPDLIIPPKFKVPEFEKYDGTECPKIHLAAYYRKMAGYTHDEKLLIHVFQDSLTGAAVKWYLKLKRDQVRTWKDLAQAFLEQYKHMVDTAPDRLTLQGMQKGPGESYREYAVRWKGLASQVKPPLTNREENSIFVDTLPSPYYDMLVGNAFTEFADLMFSVGRIEDGIRRGRIADAGASILEKKGMVFDEHVQTMSMERGNKRKSCIMKMS